MTIKEKAQLLNKVIDLSDLSRRIAEYKSQGLKVVMCHGVFDLVHIGHIRHFKQARELGDVLVVTVTPDRFVNKGTNRPVFTENLRLEALASFDAINFVALNNAATTTETLRLLRPDIYCKGAEYKQQQVDAATNMTPELNVASELGIEVEYTEDIVFSSSSLLNSHFSSHDTKTDQWLKGFRDKYSAEEIIGYIKGMASLKVVVIGEAIIDEYVYCEALGKSSKDPVLACKYTGKDTFAGGSLAVANHLAGFCGQVELITLLGERKRREEFVRESLQANVKFHFVTKNQAPTIHKRRYIEQYSQHKLFEMYDIDDHPLLAGGPEESALLDLVDASDVDVVIVADYGHGMMSPALIKAVVEKTAFLTINTQSNAGNRGFNSISRYPRADYICLAKHEVCLETRLRDAALEDLLMELANRIDCNRFTVTNGKNGSLHYEKERGVTEVPAFATKVVDRVGAGDSLLAVSSCLVAQGVPWEVVGFVGNLAGAQTVAELGNRVPVDQIALCKHVIATLK